MKEKILFLVKKITRWLFSNTVYDLLKEILKMMIF